MCVLITWIVKFYLMKQNMTGHATEHNFDCYVVLIFCLNSPGVMGQVSRTGQFLNIPNIKQSEYDPMPIVWNDRCSVFCV